MQIMLILNLIIDSIVLSDLPKFVFAIIVLVLSFTAVCGDVCAQDQGGAVIRYLPPLWPFHAFLVSLGLIFMIVAMLMARRRKGRRGWLKTHKTLGLLGVSLAIAGVLMAVYMGWAKSFLFAESVPQHLQEDTYTRNSKNMHREIG
jgi:hypothetical protein